MILDLDPAYIGSVATATAIGAGFAGLALQQWLTRRFPTLERMAQVEARVQQIEQLTDKAAPRDDVTELQRRLSAVEAGVAQIHGELGGIRDGVGQVQLMVKLLIDNGLREGRDAG